MERIMIGQRRSSCVRACVRRRRSPGRDCAGGSHHGSRRHDLDAQRRKPISRRSPAMAGADRRGGEEGCLTFGLALHQGLQSGLRYGLH